MGRTLRLELPEPPPILSPNSRAIPFLKREAQRMAIAEVAAAVEDAGYDPEPPIVHGRVTVTFIVSRRGPRDKGNLI